MSERHDRAWGKDPSGPLHDPAKEEFARLIASGSSQKGAASQLGVHAKTASVWFSHEKMQERLADLRGGSGLAVPISVGWIAQQLKENVEKAREKGDFSASNQALKQMRELLADQAKALGSAARATTTTTDLPVLEDGERTELLQKKLGAPPVYATVLDED